MKKINFEQTTLYRRAFGGWKTTVALLFVFTLCTSAIIALAYNSRHESRDTLPTEHSVASSSLPIQTENVVSIDETSDEVEVSPVETSESDEIVFDETPIDVEIKASAIERLEETTSDSEEAHATETVFEESPIIAESKPEETENVELCATNASFELRTGSISEIRIGYRVPGTNPEGNDGSDESVFVNEKHVVYTLRVPKADGTFCTAKLLRSEDWLYEAPTRLVSLFDGHVFNEVDAALAEMTLLPSNFYRDFEIEVWIDLEDQGCVGWSKIVEIDETFKYSPGEGNLVTGTFEHVAQDVIDLQIEGQEKPIGCTPTHPIWSEDREEFVPAGELFEGERVRVLNGDTKRVLQKLPRPGPELVYNIEVFGEHVYHVTSDGVLVHNWCSIPQGKKLRSYEKYEVWKRGNSILFVPKDKNLAPVGVGPYGSLNYIKLRITLFGNDIHHILRTKIIEKMGVKRRKGTGISIPNPDHITTSTYGRGITPGTPINLNNELKRDLKEIAEILKKAGYNDNLIAAVKREITKQNQILGVIEKMKDKVGKTIDF